VIEAWMINKQRIFRLVVSDAILHTQFICHVCTHTGMANK